MVGNAGVGKTFLINSLAGTTLFRSRSADHRNNFCTKTHLGTTYSNTPGLEDIEPRERAAHQISCALQAGGNFKLVFVTVLEHGRARLADILTIRMVLHAVKPVLDGLGVPIRFSILVNMCRPQIMSGLDVDGNREILRGYYSLAEQAEDWDFKNCGMGFVPMRQDSISRSNMMIECPDYLRLFITEAPELRIPYGRGVPVGDNFNANTIAQIEQVRRRRSSMNDPTLMFTTLARVASNVGSEPASESALKTPPGPHVVMVGTPGVGKSFLLNALAGTRLFSSGVNSNSAKTTHFVMKRHNGATFSDTPGLNEIAGREQAAKQISRAIQHAGTFKLIFVTGLEDGRVRPADVAIIRVVLRAIEPVMRDNDMSDGFSVLVNKCSPRLMRMLENEEEVEKFRALYSAGDIRNVGHIGFLPRRREAADRRGVLLKCSDDLREFVAKAPDITIPIRANVQIQTEDFDSIHAGITDRIEFIRKQVEKHGKEPGLMQTVLMELMPSFTYGAGGTLIKGMAAARVSHQAGASTRSLPHVSNLFQRLTSALR